MADPFLTAHQLGPRTYSVGGKLHPISVRDQLVRGEMFAQRAFERGLIGPDRDPLVVIGAGAAGVAAALRAAVEYKADVRLFDRSTNLFCVQAGCSNRRIEPTAYDFPLTHWRAGSYPLASAGPGPGWQLQWPAGEAQLLALAWRRAFDAAAIAPGVRLQFQPRSTLAGRPNLDPGGQFVTAELDIDDPNDPPSRRVRERAAVVLLAVGFGREKRYLRSGSAPPHPSWGYHFWEDDHLSEPDLGVPSGDAAVLISGSGDGSLQDFLRVVTTPRRVTELYDAVFGHAPLGDGPFRRLMEANDAAARAYAWGCQPVHDHNVLREVHAAHAAVIDGLFAAHGPALRYAIGGVLRDPLPVVSLVYACNHFSNCFSLNRLLVLAVRRHLENEGRAGGMFLPGKRVVGISPADGHECRSDPEGCHGREHEVTWAACGDCRRPADPAEASGTLRANVLVLRHGIDMQDLPWNTSPPVLRQLLPYAAQE